MICMIVANTQDIYKCINMLTKINKLYIWYYLQSNKYEMATVISSKRADESQTLQVQYYTGTLHANNQHIKP